MNLSITNCLRTRLLQLTSFSHTSSRGSRISPATSPSKPQAIQAKPHFAPKKFQDRRKFPYKLIPSDYYGLRRKLAIIGAPLIYGQPLTGANAAPDLLRASNLKTRMERKGAIIEDHGDLQFELVPNDIAIKPGCKYAKTVGRANQKIAEVVSKVVRNGRQCLVLGGDHSVGMGSVYGHIKIREDAIIIWVDAHADINTPLTTHSGNLHGMAVGFLVKEIPHFETPVPGLEWLEPCVHSDQLAYIGLRSVDPGEKVILKKLDIVQYSCDDLRNLGADVVMKNIFEKLDPQGKRPIHLSFDVDVLDPSIMPCTGTPVANGMTLRQALRIARIIHSTGRLSVMDLVELNPMVTASRWLAMWSADVCNEIIIRSMAGKQRDLPWDVKWKHRGAYLRSLVLPRFRSRQQHNIRKGGEEDKNS